jgi:hypothetical protein
MVVLLGRIELSTSSLPRQGMDFQKVGIIKGYGVLPAGALLMTHAIPKLWRVPDLGFSY